MVENLSAVRETQVRSLGQEDEYVFYKKEMLWYIRTYCLTSATYPDIIHGVTYTQNPSLWMRHSVLWDTYVQCSLASKDVNIHRRSFDNLEKSLPPDCLGKSPCETRDQVPFLAAHKRWWTDQVQGAH